MRHFNQECLGKVNEGRRFVKNFKSGDETNFVGKVVFVRSIVRINTESLLNKLELIRVLFSFS